MVHDGLAEHSNLSWLGLKRRSVRLTSVWADGIVLLVLICYTRLLFWARRGEIAGKKTRSDLQWFQHYII